MNRFTHGVWSVTNSDHGELEMHCIGFPDYPIMGNQQYYPWNSENEHDWYLFATAGKTATKLAEDGYDAVKVLEVLPQLVHSIEIRDWYHIHMLLQQCRSDL